MIEGNDSFEKYPVEDEPESPDQIFGRVEAAISEQESRGTPKEVAGVKHDLINVAASFILSGYDRYQKGRALCPPLFDFRGGCVKLTL